MRKIEDLDGDIYLITQSISKSSGGCNVMNMKFDKFASLYDVINWFDKFRNKKIVNPAIDITFLKPIELNVDKYGDPSINFECPDDGILSRSDSRCALSKFVLCEPRYDG